MTPAPRNPIPETTCAATRVGLLSSGVIAASATNAAAPMDTGVLVGSRASRGGTCRSRPMAAPRSAPRVRRTANVCQSITHLRARFGAPSQPRSVAAHVPALHDLRQGTVAEEQAD